MNPIVKLRNQDGEICTIRKTGLMTHLAAKWNNILGNRRHWNQQCAALQNVRDEALRALEELEIKPRQLEQIAASGVIEVSTRYYSDLEYGKETRTIPWEHLLTAGTKSLRGEHSLTVVRHLKGVKKKKRSKTGKANKDSVEHPLRFAFVGAAPEPLHKYRSFAAEMDLVASGFLPLLPPCSPQTMSQEQLSRFTAQAAPEVVHFSAVDAHFGEQRMGGYLANEMTFCPDIIDGVFLWNDLESHEQKIAPFDIAECLTAAAHKPALAVINSWYSGSTTAPACVAAGATAAVGFHNSFDEQAAYEFYRQFYRAWATNGRDHLAAFQFAWRNIKVPSAKTRGTAITLWSANSIVGQEFDEDAEASENSVSVASSFAPRVTTADPTRDKIKDLIGIEVQPIETLNYSLLHNRRSLMERLHLWFRSSTPDHQRQVNLVEDINVEVTLSVGDAAFSYFTTVVLGEETCQIDLADASLAATGKNPAGGIFVPLTSALFRSIDESMQTSMLIHITWHDQTIYRHTHTVSLAPIDQWVLDQTNIGWLPSFVQPRDPAVRKIIKSAQKYLRCLEDDPHAGFRGYQADDVDHQVKAIWSAIVYDFSLDYVSPPPSYTNYTQRLRSPRQVIEEDRGTCVDLAILFASCVEWIELHPVIFLTSQHAFAGYWKTDEAHTNFVQTIQNEVETFGTSRRMVAERFPWATLTNSWSEIRRLIMEQDLIPVEAVALTERSSFHGAFEQGYMHFITEDNPDHISPVSQKPVSEEEEATEPGVFGTFTSLVDVTASRQFVTPLPISGINRAKQ